MKRVMCLLVVLASTTAILAAELKVKVAKLDGDTLTVTTDGGKELKLDVKDAKIVVGKDGQEREVPPEAKARVLKEGVEITITFDREKKTISKIFMERKQQ